MHTLLWTGAENIDRSGASLTQINEALSLSPNKEDCDATSAGSAEYRKWKYYKLNTEV